MSIIVTCGHTRQALSAVRSLGKNSILVCATSFEWPFLSMWSKYVSSSFLSEDPKKNPEKFAKNLASEMNGRNAKILMPGSDDAFWAISRFREYFPNSQKQILPPHISVVRALDHQSLYDFAESLEIPCVPILKFFKEDKISNIENEIKNIKYPVLIRPIVSWIEREDGVRKINKKYIVSNQKELLYTLKEKGFLQTGFLICNYHTKNSKAVFGVAFKGKILSIGFQERLFEEEPLNEVATLSESIKPIPILKNYAEVLLAGLNWQGPFKLEFIEDDQKNYKLVSLIGRLWASLELSYRAKINIPYLTYLVSMGKVDFPYKVAIPGIRLRWLLGDIKARITSLNFSKFFSLKTKNYLDVFDLSDPLPFVFELKKFIRSLLTRKE